MAAKKPKFEYEGFCRECGTRTRTNFTGTCEPCWSEKQKERKRQQRENRGANKIKKHMQPYVEQLQAGASPIKVLTQILTDAGYQVSLDMGKTKNAGSK